MPYANKERYKQWYAANRERMIAKAKAWDLAHPERAAEKKREYIERHPERRAETQRKWQSKPEVRERTRELRAKRERREKMKALQRGYVATIHDGYVRRVMAQRLGVKGSELPQTLVDAQRELMKLKRAINEQL